MGVAAASQRPPTVPAAGIDPTSPTMAMSKSSQRRIDEVKQEAKDRGETLSKAEARKQAKEAGRNDKDDKKDFAALPQQAAAAMHGVAGAAGCAAHWAHDHPAVILGGAALVGTAIAAPELLPLAAAAF